jgi:peptidoglycan/LPS O-acetylase OafA/YrhL
MRSRSTRHWPGRESVPPLPMSVSDPELGRDHLRSAPSSIPGFGGGALPPHIPSLDGLRAVSFLIVFLAHAGLQWIVPGGFGVTVFFYLSGFLITTLMRVEHETTGTVSVRHFYLRRVLRILPPFYLVLIMASTLTLLGVLPGELQSRVVLAQALHVSNYWLVWHGYAGAAAGTVPFWSLAVEEHFYLLFPLLYLWLRRHISSRAHAKTFWTLCVIVCAWRCMLVFVFGVTEDRTYMASDTRFDSILFGCALAVTMNPVLDGQSGSDRLWKNVLLPAGLALLLVTFAYRAPWFRETIRYTLQGIGLTPVFVAAMRFPDWWPFRFLNAKRVAFAGVLSYTLYLVHQIALYAVGFRLPALNAVLRSILALLISLILAITIHQLVEKPCARIRKRLAPGGHVIRLPAIGRIQKVP